MPTPSDRAPIEARAELRQFAHLCREMYVALLQEGFTAPEAMNIIGVTIAANMGGGRS